MPRKVTPLDTDDLIRKYEAGESLARLGDTVGLRQNQLRKRLVAAGLVLRPHSASKIKAVDTDRIVAAYTSGASEKQVAKELGVSRRLIRDRLISRGIEPRGRSDAERLKWSKFDRPAIERQCGAAWKATRGRVHTKDEIAARAITGFVRQSKLVGRHEDTVATILAGAGIPFERQLPWGPYNIDFAAHEARVAIEVLGSIVTHAARDRIRERTEHLLDGGWCVLFLYVGPLWGGRFVEVDRSFVAEELIALVNRARRGEPVHGRYRVIRGDGKSTSMLRRYLDDLPVV